MQKLEKALFIALVMGLLIIRPMASYADWNGHGGHEGHDGHGHDHHDHSYIGVDLSAWPDNYYYGAPYYAPADEVLVSPPVTVVQPQPVTVYQPSPVITNPTPDVDQGGTFTINIPNNKGGYTAVLLKQSGNGYIGPQGEYYPEFPKVSQLELMYGK